MSFSLEPRTDAPRWLASALTIAAFVFALVLSAVVIALVGGDPIRSYLHILGAAFGSVGRHRSGFGSTYRLGWSGHLHVRRALAPEDIQEEFAGPRTEPRCRLARADNHPLARS